MKSKRAYSLTLAVHLAVGGAALGSAAHAEPPLQASDSQPREAAVGTGAGAVIGGILAGPPGVMVGAITGNVIGRGRAVERELHATRAELAEARNALERQRRRARLRERRRDRPEIHPTVVASRTAVPLGQAPGVAEALERGLAFTVQFRTDSHRVESHFEAQLEQFARTLAEFPQLRVRLDGFADRRGEADYNRALSSRRVAAVRRVLVQAGLEPQRILESAHGERRPLYSNSDPESHDFERRVLITLEGS